jgi:ribosomal protein S6--L-glutamate ligase
MLFLSLGGVRIPETIIFREESYATNRDYIVSHSVFPLVYKIDGSKGRDVHIAHSISELDTLVKNKHPRRLALIQPFIENTFDTRTLVAFNVVLGSIKRTRTSGYLNNIAQGATASHMDLTVAEKDVAQVAAKVCGIDFGGVDMIHTPEGPIVLEVNKSPQIGGFESVHNFKVFTKIAELMQSKFGE